MLCLFVYIITNHLTFNRFILLYESSSIVWAVFYDNNEWAHFEQRHIPRPMYKLRNTITDFTHVHMHAYIA